MRANCLTKCYYDVNVYQVASIQYTNRRSTHDFSEILMEQQTLSVLELDDL